MSVAKLIERRTHLVPGKLKVSELFFDVPRDYSKPADGNLRLFARSVERVEKPSDGPKEEKKHLPWFVYLQGTIRALRFEETHSLRPGTSYYYVQCQWRVGGPGHPCGPPQKYPWTQPVLEKGYQMLFLDQRGTGLSSTITADTLARQGKPREQAAYLLHFRADNIVRDCEAIRRTVTEGYPEEKKKWTVMGQSFGGFCTLTYLSKHPEGLQEAFICGGLAPPVNGPDEVYERTYRKLAERNEAYYKKFPEDVDRVKHIVKRLHHEPPSLPSGGTLSVSRFRALGIAFGGHGGLDVVHDVVLRASNDLEQYDCLTRPTLSTIDNFLPFDDNVLYAVLHEACYLQGEASRWSADRVMQSLPRFQLSNPEAGSDGGDSVYFTGEMIYRSMFEDFAELRKLRETAEIVAEMDDWPNLYDIHQLENNEVPVYAVTYIDDMYVDYDLAQQRASKIKNCKQFITNVMYHNGLGSKSDEVMKQLFALRDDVID